MEVLVVIPARGNSKGIPRKNIKILCGKPLIGWSIEVARKTPGISRIVVSTEDPEIEEVARIYGAEVITRPYYLAEDKVRSEDVVINVLEHLKEKESYYTQIVIMMQCTSPLIDEEDIANALKQFYDEKLDVCFSGCLFNRFLWKVNSEGGLKGINHNEEVRLRRQDFPPQYIEVGAFYIMDAEKFMIKKHRFFGRMGIYLLSPEKSVEIDEYYDWIVAERLMREKLNKKKLSYLPSKISALALDFDGVLTDNKVIVKDNGSEFVICDRGDGIGLELLKEHKIKIGVFSSEENMVVAQRCKKLNVEFFIGLKDKAQKIREWLQVNNIRKEEVIYVGNDLNDIPCIKEVGCFISVANAREEVKSMSVFVLENRGGEGAVREICELIIKKLGVERNE